MTDIQVMLLVYCLCIIKFMIVWGNLTLTLCEEIDLTSVTSIINHTWLKVDIKEFGGFEELEEAYN